MRGERLEQELMLTEPMVGHKICLAAERAANSTQVLSSVMKWCWSRLAGGVVSWEAYELFRVGEQGKSSQYAIGSFRGCN